MKNLNPLLLCDFYKTVHSEQYPKGLTKIVSYFTPRMTRIRDQNYLIMFGLQGFIKKYLINYFNENFFSKSENEVVDEYNRILSITLGSQNFNSDKIRKLHKLGYLPIEINGLKEGTKCPIHVPMFEITNTHPEFAWLVNGLETLISTSMWYPMVTANVGYEYRKIINKFYNETVDDNISKARAIGDFGMRGGESLEGATMASAAFLLSFLNTATIPAIYYHEQFYNVKIGKDEIGYGSPSTEHSVMCSNYGFDGDEETMIRRLLTEIYPNSSFSAVLDSYNYWNVVENILPKLKKEILEHNGTFLVRGDSGDPVEIVTETVFKLWNIFGGSLNSKGYKVLNPKIKAIYGDSITPQRAELIYTKLQEMGFAANNVALGVGSFSMQSIEENGTLKPFTRDTFGIAIKATYAEFTDEFGNIKFVPIFKNPITDTGNFKKSQKGCIWVKSDLSFTDNYTWPDVIKLREQDNAYIPYFKNGKMITEQSLPEIRNFLHDNKF